MDHITHIIGAGDGEPLRELRGGGCTGGFLLRRSERFTGVEVHTWWIDGRR